VAKRESVNGSARMKKRKPGTRCGQGAESGMKGPPKERVTKLTEILRTSGDPEKGGVISGVFDKKTPAKVNTGKNDERRKSTHAYNRKNIRRERGGEGRN